MVEHVLNDYNWEKCKYAEILILMVGFTYCNYKWCIWFKLNYYWLVENIQNGCDQKKFKYAAMLNLVVHFYLLQFQFISMIKIEIPMISWKPTKFL